MLKYEDLTVGKTLTVDVNKLITRQQLQQYAKASGDLNPLHTDDEFAKKIGMPSVIAHGMLIMGQLGKYVTNLAGDTATVKQYKMRFGAMTFPNDEITCVAVVKSLSEHEGKSCAALTLYASKEQDTIVGTGQAILEFH
ncbi:MaoC/PaaZ C-terminal domain-containing protein [Kurthia sibirica]|uniref:Dehydratase n=1 Tax=Kurthia sibirica TaxID=202750 RepID=A0A2U3ALH4_9BACL|nr:MaoC/PaaZ C-terminal domain-containing protein [Kurthia sibirica]PWI25383.1 dehydratase [Kurthia sibirica]GEK34600.1 3-hydroxyacyl-ACP dehydratase [Kurthia sibirica]